MSAVRNRRSALALLFAVFVVAFDVAVRASVVDFYPHSTKITNGMIQRHASFHGSRWKREAPGDEKVDLNALVPGLAELSEYEEKHNCRCVAFYNCCNTSRTAGFCEGVIDIRNNLDFTDEHCKVDYHQCCSLDMLCGDDAACLARLIVGTGPTPSSPVQPPKPKPGPVPTPPSPPGPDHPAVTPAPATPPATDVRPRPPPAEDLFTTTQRPAPTVRVKCGVRNVDGVGVRLAGSGEIKRTQYGEFPWMAALLRQDSVGRESPVDIYIGGGVLVSPHIVLTAAHNVIDYAKGHFFNLKVRLGEWDALSEQEPFRQEDYKLKHVIVHPDFKTRVLLNDVAVLVLERPVEIHQHISPICLPDEKHEEEYQQRGPNCIVTGWGKDSFFGNYQNILKLIELPMVPKEQCEEKMRATRLGPAFRLHESFICAGGEGVDACKGDGGSPLACPALHHNPSDPRYVLTGLVAWGIGCADIPPGVYVNIPRFVPWIRDFIKEHDPDYNFSVTGDE